MGFCKKIQFISLLLLLAANTLFARIFFVGSNPHLTVFAFPQDVLLVPGEAVYYYVVYQSLPWWGDIDEPEVRPNKEYVLTGERIGGTSDDSDFEHNTLIHLIQNHIGFTRALSGGRKARFDLTYKAKPMRSSASGFIEIDGGGTELPYTYKGHNSIQELHLRSILATKYKGFPVGFMMGLGGVYATKPNVDFQATGSGVEYSSDRLLWGWNGEYERFQNEYAVGPLAKLDLQAATTFPKIKFGGRFRYYRGNLNQYSWNSNNAANDLEGAYEKSTKKIRNITVRLYGNRNWIRRKKFAFNTLFLTRYTHVDSIGVLPDNLDATTGIVEKSQTFVFQFNPNINLYPWKHKMTYIDAAILCNYSHMRYKFTQPRWIGGGIVDDAYMPTRVYSMEEHSWQNYSYGRQNFFEYAFDFNSVFPVYGRKDQSVALGVTLLIWTRFKWFDKYYGTYPSSAFEIENIRNNYERETWLNSAINIIHRRGKFMYRLDVGQPLIYTLTPRTRVTDRTGDTILYEKTKESMWLSQSGLRLGFFVSTSLENFLENRPFKRRK